jgi:hypothetical protein
VKTLSPWIDLHQEKIKMAIHSLRAWWKEMEANWEATEANPEKLEANPTELESVAEHREVCK